MQSIVGLERVRITNTTEERLRSQLALIRERDTAGAEHLRTSAAEETTAVDQWVESETKRIAQEADRRKRNVQDVLHESLAAHRSRFDGAVQGVESAIATYRAEVDEFFTRLEGVDDPVVLAERAVKHPKFPALPAVPETIGFLEPRGSRPESAAATTDAAGTADGPEPAEETAAGNDGEAPAATAVVEAAEGSSNDSTAIAEPTELPSPATGDAAREHEPVHFGNGGAGGSGLLQRTVAAFRPVSKGVGVMSSDADGECEYCSSSRSRGAAYCVSCGRDLRTPVAAE